MLFKVLYDEDYGSDQAKHFKDASDKLNETKKFVKKQIKIVDYLLLYIKKKKLKIFLFRSE